MADRRTKAQLLQRVAELEKQLVEKQKELEGQQRSMDLSRRAAFERRDELRADSRELHSLRRRRMVRAMVDVGEMRPGDRLIYEAPSS